MIPRRASSQRRCRSRACASWAVSPQRGRLGEAPPSRQRATGRDEQRARGAVAPAAREHREGRPRSPYGGFDVFCRESSRNRSRWDTPQRSSITLGPTPPPPRSYGASLQAHPRRRSRLQALFVLRSGPAQRVPAARGLAGVLRPLRSLYGVRKRGRHLSTRGACMVAQLMRVAAQRASSPPAAGGSLPAATARR